MDTCPFVRLIVESLAIKLPAAASAGCYAKLKLSNLPSQTALLPVPLEPPGSSASFHLEPDALRLLSCNPLVTLKISVFTSRAGRACGLNGGKLLGSVKLFVNMASAQERCCVHHSGWMKLGGALADGDPVARLYFTVRSEPDPRFVFQFGGEPKCGPVVFQIQDQGSIRQPVFSCKFSADRNNRSRSLPSNFIGWTKSFFGEREKGRRERKGWMITYGIQFNIRLRRGCS